VFADGLSIGDVAQIEMRQPKLVQMFNSSTTVEHLTSSRHITNMPVSGSALYFLI
jgi:hypothetical protein